MITKEDEMKIERLLAEYHECSEDHRDFGRNLWQTPSAAVLITGALLGIAYSYALNVVVRVLLLVLSIAIDLILVFVMDRYRFFGNARIQRVRELEKQLDLNRMEIVDSLAKQHWIGRHSPYNYAIFFVSLLIILLSGLTIWEIHGILTVGL